MKTGLESLADFDRDHIWHPFTSLKNRSKPIFVSSAKGLYLHTDDGRKIMDVISSWWVNIHGHSHPYIAEAIAKQAATLEHVIFAGFTHEPAVTLSKNILSILPGDMSRVFFSDNGSTGVEVGIKMALQYWFNKGIKKTKIIAFKGAYHGDTFGAMSVGERSAFTKPFNHHLFEVHFINVPTQQNIATVLEEFTRFTNTDDVAAFIYEPLVQGAAGMVMHDPILLDQLLKVAKERDVLCLADEVFTGFGRTGKLFASDYLSTFPDIICVSKGITGGTLPLGLTCCSSNVEEAFQSTDANHTFYHGHSYTANPLACAAANASFDLLMNQDCQQRINRISAQHNVFKDEVQKHKNVLEARSTGTILAIEIATTETTSYFNSIRNKAYSFFLERDILIRPLGNVVYVVPPYIIQEDELNHVYSVIKDFLDLLKD